MPRGHDNVIVIVRPARRDTVQPRLLAGGLGAVPSAAESWPGRSAEEILQMKEDYKRDVNPSGEVPTLTVGDVSVAD